VKLSESVTTIQKGIQSVVQRAEQAHGQMESSRGAVEAMTSTIPDIVNRIEASDAAKKISEFSSLLAELRDLISSQQGLTQGMQSVADQFSVFSTEIQSVKHSMGQQGQLLQLINQVLMQNVAGPVTENTRLLADIKGGIQDIGQGANKASEGMASVSIRLIKEVEALRKDVSALRADVSTSNHSLEDQRMLLEKAANKKGFSF
jgi:methyl-accepting chemotaxis protein